MAKGSAFKTNLLNASAKTDWRISGGYLYITGLDKIKISDIVKIDHKRSRAEVVQVYTIGTSAPTVTAGTKYSIELLIPVKDQGSPLQTKVYSYTAPLSLSGNAATDRSLMYNALAAKINKDLSAFVTAAADVGGTGVSMTLTDKAGYYAARPSTRGGATGVKLPSGFNESTHLVKTTAAVYALGIGSRMVQDLPVSGPVTGNLDTGEYDGPVGAVSGQTYDLVAVTHNVDVNHMAVAGLAAKKQVQQWIWVDNGKGTSTTNATGFAAFIKEVNRSIFDMYVGGPAAIVERFEDSPRFVKADGYSAPDGTNGASALWMGKNGQLIYTYIGAAIIVAPVWSNSGVKLDLDVTDTEGLELSPNLGSNDPRSFIVGQTPFSMRVVANLAIIANGVFIAGFRKKAAFNATFTNYTDVAAIGNTVADNASLITYANLAGAGFNNTDSGIDIANGTDFELEIQVDGAGYVSAFINGVSYPIYSAGTTQLKLVAGNEFVPFVRAVNDGGSAPVTTLKEFEAIADIIVRDK